MLLIFQSQYTINALEDIKLLMSNINCAVQELFGVFKFPCGRKTVTTHCHNTYKKAILSELTN